MGDVSMGGRGGSYSAESKGSSEAIVCGLDRLRAVAGCCGSLFCIATRVSRRLAPDVRCGRGAWPSLAVLFERCGPPRLVEVRGSPAAPSGFSAVRRASVS